MSVALSTSESPRTDSGSDGQSHVGSHSSLQLNGRTAASISLVPTDGPIGGDTPSCEDPADTVVLPTRDLAGESPALRSLSVDPRGLRDNPRNLRSSIGDLDDLKASVAVVGVLCPLVVIPVSGNAVDDIGRSSGGDDRRVDGNGTVEEFQIIIGHRRKYAAIELGMASVPCVVAADEGEALHIVAQLAENGHRVGLTATEEAEAYHQLTLLDWTPDQIGKVRAIPAAQVRKALQLRDLPQPARDAADSGVLTLDDAAAMAEFADEPAAFGRLLKSAGSGWGFQHAVAAERSKRDSASARERVRAELVLAGVKVTAKPPQFGYGSTAVDARHLVDADGRPVDVDEVRTKPGFAAFVERIGDAASATVYCTDPAKYGYSRSQPTHSGFGLSDEERAAKEEADRAREALREGLIIADGVRPDFYRQTYGNARVAKRLFVEALRETVITSMADNALRFTDLDGLYSALGGATDGLVDAAKEDRLRRCLVAQWICAHETNLRHVSAGRHWALDAPAAAFWLDQLVADGYALSEAEDTLRQQLTADLDDEVEDETDGLDADGESEDGSAFSDGNDEVLSTEAAEESSVVAIGTGSVTPV